MSELYRLTAEQMAPLSPIFPDRRDRRDLPHTIARLPKSGIAKGDLGRLNDWRRVATLYDRSQPSCSGGDQ